MDSTVQLVARKLKGNWIRFRRCLFPFRKRSMPFLTVDAIIGNQAFSHGSGLGLGLPIIHVSAMNDS